MAATCESHPFETATDTCKTCKYDFCPECLVYPHAGRDPFCVPCALSAAGVRSTAARQPRREVRRHQPRRSFNLMAGNVGVWVASAVAVAGGVVALALA